MYVFGNYSNDGMKFDMMIIINFDWKFIVLIVENFWVKSFFMINMIVVINFKMKWDMYEMIIMID